ncbi:MAG: hypothetical protein RJA70_2882 [Pseudomonadota bacterium]|jgi:mono/diheme cytochrome c family protein
MSHENETQTTAVNNRPYGLLAEYDGPDQLIAAAKQVSAAGYSRWDCYSPFPVHGIDPAMRIKRTKLPYIVVVAGLTGTTTALVMQWWTNAVDYPLIVSGKPFFGVPANIPITFELTVLFAAITTFVSMLLLNGLPKHSSPLDYVKRFDRASDDKFFIVIESEDPKYDEAQTQALFQRTHAAAVESVPADTTSDQVPKGVIYAILIIAALALVPFGLFASARSSTSGDLPFHLVHNMDFQEKYKPQKKSDFFADHRTSRGDVEGTIAVGALRHDSHFFAGRVGDAWALTLPDRVVADAATMARGQEKFGVYCAPCHGATGAGDGMVHRRAFALKEGTWVKPTNISDRSVAIQPIGQLFNAVTHGIRQMPAYGSQVETADRWAILLYVRALQHSQKQYGSQEAPVPAATDTAPASAPTDAPAGDVPGAPAAPVGEPAATAAPQATAPNPAASAPKTEGADAPAEKK